MWHKGEHCCSRAWQTKVGDRSQQTDMNKRWNEYSPVYISLMKSLLIGTFKRHIVHAAIRRCKLSIYLELLRERDHLLWMFPDKWIEKPICLEFLYVQFFPYFSLDGHYCNLQICLFKKSWLSWQTLVHDLLIHCFSEAFCVRFKNHRSRSKCFTLFTETN